MALEFHEIQESIFNKNVEDVRNLISDNSFPAVYPHKQVEKLKYKIKTATDSTVPISEGAVGDFVFPI